jgi:NADH-quinone oxidoreductase subunit N
MTVANLVALAQTNIKRLLAFSSISHAGYLMIALTCKPDRAVSAIVFYLAAYAFMTVGAFVVAAAVGRGDSISEEGYDLRDWQGLGWKRPGLGVAMTIFMLSLAGIPPTAGFLGKYVIFQAAVDSGRWLLAFVGILNAVIGAYYYLRVIVNLWMREPETDEVPLPVTVSTAIVLIVAVVGVFYLGLAPGALLDATRGLYALLI